jgi:hypothetical protein
MGRTGEMMMGASRWLILPWTVGLLLSGDASASRIAPPDVKPVVRNGVRYEVPHFGAFHGKDQNGGFVQAWDVGTNTLLWDRMIYRVTYSRDRPGCVQDTFITSIHLNRDVMIVTNEQAEEFELNLTTGKVRALTRVRGNRSVPRQVRPASVAP